MKRRRPPAKPRTGPRPARDGWDQVTSQSAGVYVIMNWVNGRCYVGSSLKLRARMLQHCSDMADGLSNSGSLRRDMNHMGADSFWVFPVVMLSPDHPRLNHALGILEQEWISHLQADEEALGYNQISNGWRTHGARMRDTERKYMRRGNYALLPSVDLYDPINRSILATWVPSYFRPDSTPLA